MRASLRKGEKILVKDIAYLGGSIEEVQKALQQLPKYNGQIRKAYKTIHHFIESNRYREKAQALKLKKDQILGEKLLEIEGCKLHYSTIFKKSLEPTKKEILRNFMIEFAYNTASIEGNTIKLNEARNLLQEGLTPKNKTIREIYDIQNTEKVFLRLLETTEELNHHLIQSLHAQLMANIDARISYRTKDVRVIKSNFDATPAPYVKTDMDLLLN